jgi:mono/diheme cytochrome c family protein
MRGDHVPRRLRTALRLGWLLVLLPTVAFALAGCGGGGSKSGSSETGTTMTHTTTTETTGTQATTTTATGDLANGKAVFAANGCGGCHTLAAASATGTIGPNLDDQLQQSARKASMSLAEFTRQSIVAPDAFVATGFSSGIMPTSFGDQLSKQDLADLVAFIVVSVQG